MKQGWWDLPSELLSLICDALEDPFDIRRVRLVCRSWRSCLPLPPNRISPLFPHRISLSSPPFTSAENQHRPIDLISKSVYLLRPHAAHPSTAFLVSIEEPNPGSLRLRHPITYLPLHISLPQPQDEWSLTQIANSHSFCFSDGTRRVLGFDDWWPAPLPPEIRRPGTKLSTAGKVVLVSSSSNPICVSDFTAVVLHSRCTNLSAFLVTSRLLADLPTKTDDIQLIYSTGSYIDDILNFNGRVFALDIKARLFIVDHQTLGLTRIDDGRCPQIPQLDHGRNRLVESKGELYMVSKFYEIGRAVHKGVVYKLVMSDVVTGRYKWEAVADLGDRVFFIAVDCSYSVSAQHLPYPWRGNCIVFDKEALWPLSMSFIAPVDKQIEVFHLGGGQEEEHVRPLSFFPAYSHLFNPFSSGVRLAGTRSLATDTEFPPSKKCKI